MGWCCLSLKTAPYSLRRWATLTTSLPWSQGTTLVVCDGWWCSQPVNSWCSLLQPEPPALSILWEGVSAASTRSQSDRWGRAGKGRWPGICGYVLFIGFSTMSAGHSRWNVASAPWQPTYIAAAFAGTSKLQDGQSYSLCPVGAAPHSLLPHSLKPRPVLEYICGSGLCLVFVLPHIMCLALTTRGPPSDVSMCGSLRYVWVK